MEFTRQNNHNDYGFEEFDYVWSMSVKNEFQQLQFFFWIPFPNVLFKNLVLYEEKVQGHLLFIENWNPFYPFCNNPSSFCFNILKHYILIFLIFWKWKFFAISMLFYFALFGIPTFRISFYVRKFFSFRTKFR